MRIAFITLVAFLSNCCLAQDTITMSKTEAEAIFLKNNLLLISEKMNIEIQEAEVLQAKLWPNPNLTFNEINFWATNRQRGGQEVSPPLWGSKNFGRNQQFAGELNQLIQTAGKRRKQIAIEQTDVSKSAQAFEEVLRDLKYEFRQLITEHQYLQLRINDLKHQQVNIQKLVEAHKRQFDKGHIAKAEYLRLKALALEMNKTLFEIQEELNSNAATLKNLMHIAPENALKISQSGFKNKTAPRSQYDYYKLLENAKENRPDLKLAQLNITSMHQKIAYEKAQAVPDIELQMNYDRNGNTMKDFIGFGMAMDLPVFNRNQGNIKKAKLGLEQAKIEADWKQKTVENELATTIVALKNADAFLNNIDEDYEQSIDDLLESYNKNFGTRTISMLEYIDYLSAYLDNKNFILEAQKNYNNNLEKLNYIVGAEVTP